MINENRLQAVVKWLSGQTGLMQKEIGERVGYNNQSAFSQVVKGLKPMPARLPAQIAALDPRINVNFLTGDSDEMLIFSPQGAPESTQSAGAGDLPPRAEEPAKTAGIFVPAELAQMFTDLTATIREQQRIIGTMVDTWAKEKEGAK